MDGLTEEISVKDQTIVDQETTLAEIKQQNKEKYLLLEKELQKLQLYHQRTIRKKDEKQQETIKEKTKNLLSENTRLLSIKDYLEKTLEEVNNSYISLSEEVQLLSQELKGEKQLTQSHLTNLKKQITNLKDFKVKSPIPTPSSSTKSTKEKKLEERIKDLEEEKIQQENEIRALKLDKEELLKLVSEKETTLLEAETNQQEQLRKINLLFDPVAKDYQEIDFNGLYALLASIAERERERERANN